MKFGFRLVGLLFSCLIAAPLAPAQVVVSEIHYHPPVADGRAIEFIEIHNAGTADVSLTGWRIQGAVDLEFPHNIIVPAGGYIIACKDCSALFTRFGVSNPQWIQNWTGSLDDGGETVELVNAEGAIVDAVPFDDRLPWPEDADGEGASLERHCDTAPAGDPFNWTARQPPTPGRGNPDPLCPPPPYFTPPIVITEVLYHPGDDAAVHSSLEDGEDEEYVEIHNPGILPVDLGGWSFDDGIDFRFPETIILGPGEFLIIARNADRVREEYGITNVIGDFDGKLSNRGERIALADRNNNWVDSVRYEDAGEWPHGADGFGKSLERISVLAPSSDPANWEAAVSGSAGGFRHLKGEGPLGQGISQRLLISIDGVGEAIVDNVRVEDVAQPGVNLITNGDFNVSLDGWIAGGTMSQSALAATEGVGGTSALRLIGNGPCPNEDCGAANSVNTKLPPGLSRETTYRVTADVKHIRGSPDLQIGLFRGATASFGEITSAGGPSTVAAAEVPPSIHLVSRSPREPTSGDPVTITAVARSAVTHVTLTFDAGSGDVEVVMADDGFHGDAAPGDGIHGAVIPPFPHNTQVRFRITAARGDLERGYPRTIEHGVWLKKELAGYYVNDNQPGSQLPTYHILLDGLTSPDFEPLNDFLNCSVPVPGSFAFRGDLWSDVGVRFRGHTACAELFRKKNLKVVFNRGKIFGNLSKINLNGMWTDKALVRERLAWEFVKEIGVPYFHTEYSRVHINGVYHGLFIYLDHHGDEFLDRNGLDGNLYLARQPPRDRPDPRGVEPHETEDGFKLAWEKETNEESDYLDIMDYVNDMHAGAGRQIDFWKDRSFVEMNIGYQLTQAVLNNIDSFAKNHFLFHDLETDRWGIITWDLDLTFGKFFTPRAVKLPERPVGTLNDIMLSGHNELGLPEDLNPWFGASVLGNPIFHHLVDFLFTAGAGHYQRAYILRLHDILMEKYTNESYDPKLDRLVDFLRDEELEDHTRWGRYPSNVSGFPEDMVSNVDVIKGQIGLHRDFLLAFLDIHHAAILDSHHRAKITEVMYWPEAGNDNLEFIEILNTNGTEINMAGWSTTGVAFTFPAGAVIPPGAHLVVAAQPGAFKARYPDFPPALVFGPYLGRLANEGEEIRLLDAGPGHPATIDYVRYENESPWPEVTPGQSLELTEPGPNRDNDPPENWIVSRVAGGTPGKTTFDFIRGDTNADFIVNITDSISLLGHLFLGGTAPRCEDAADTDDSGSLTVGDAVFLLNHLFLSGTAPPAPYPEQGSDLTDDTLSCV